MTFHKLDIFDAGRLRNYEHWRLYALFCMQSPTKALVKVGVSSIVYDRLLVLRAGLPFRIGVCLHVPVGERGLTMALEHRLHLLFKHRNTRGEWFEFDMGNPADKAEFHGHTKDAYRDFTGNELKWDRITEKQLTAYATYKAKRPKQRAA